MIKTLINKFKKNRQIEFYSLMPGVDKLYPITPAADFRPSWIKSAAAKYKETCSHFPQKKVTSVLKCPGIVDYMSKGYILYNYFDFAVRSMDSNSPPMFDMTLEQSRLFGGTLGLGRYVDVHAPDALSNFMSPPVGANSSILKISTAWRISAPDDIVFLELPVFYSGENRFLPIGGILDPKDSAPINPSFWWFANDNKWHTVRAGTPLIQYIPIPRNSELTYLVREATEQESKNNKIYDIMLNSSFRTNVKKRNELTRKIFKEK